MSGPAPHMVELAKWRRVMTLSAERLRANRNDPVALEGLNAGRSAIQGIVSQMRRTPEPRPGTLGGRVVAFGQGAASGLVDEMAGMVDATVAHPGQAAALAASAMFPIMSRPVMGSLARTPEFASGAQQSRDYLSTARTNDPIGTTIADAGGFIAQNIIGGQALRQAVPALGRLADVATKPPTSWADLLIKMPTRAAQTAVSAAEIGGQAAARVAGESEDNRLRNAAIAFPIATGAALPFAAAGVGAGLTARSAWKAMRPTGAPPTQVRPVAPEVTPRVDPEAGRIRGVLERQGFNEADIQRALRIRAQQMGGTPVPATPSQAADATHAVRPVRPNPEAPQATPEGVEIPPILQGQVRTPSPEVPGPVVRTEVAAPAATSAPRGATQAQLAYRQGDMATRFLTNPPTENAAVSIRALFANMPKAERGVAMDAFLADRAPQGVHAGWETILTRLRNLP